MIRKLKAKWTRINPIEGTDAIPADLITNDLQTFSNTLSLWSVDSEDCIDDAILALATSFSYINAFDIIRIDILSIQGKGLALKQTDGDTKYDKYRNRHYDLTDLTYLSLGVFAGLILENRSAIERLRPQRLKEILKDGIDTNKIDKADLDPHILASLNL
jgi:hypothetical protein